MKNAGRTDAVLLEGKTAAVGHAESSHRTEIEGRAAWAWKESGCADRSSSFPSEGHGGRVIACYFPRRNEYGKERRENGPGSWASLRARQAVTAEKGVGSCYQLPGTPEGKNRFAPGGTLTSDCISRCFQGGKKRKDPLDLEEGDPPCGVPAADPWPVAR